MFFSGCLAFLIMISGDFVELHGKKPVARILFFTGLVLLGLSCAGLIYLNYSAGGRPLAARLVFGALGAVFFGLLIYTLFFAIPFKGTYIEEGAQGTVESGVYALCRHPGIWFFALFAFCLWAALELPWYAALAYSLLDLLYAYIEDKLIFPKTLSGYDEYKKKVPFIIPRFRRKRAGSESGRFVNLTLAEKEGKR